MGDISKHFGRSEFECPCGCGFNTADVELVHVLEIVRVKFCKPVVITSGSRCKKHNAEIRGASNSQHLYGKAADFCVLDIHEDFVADFLEKTFPNQYGIGRYVGRTHVDVRPGPARWDMRKED